MQWCERAGESEDSGLANGSVAYHHGDGSLGDPNGDPLNKDQRGYVRDWDPITLTGVTSIGAYDPDATQP